jgi:hypothetical protein
MYRLFFKPDEEVTKVADQDDDEDLLTDDDKGNHADGDRKMRDVNPSLNPQGSEKESSFVNPQPSAPQSRKSHRQATLIQEALDLACEQLFDEISIRVMLEKDSVGWKTYSLLTDEERRMYNARVTPIINPHTFFSDEFEQDPGLSCAFALVGGTPLLSYPEAHPVQVEGGIAPTPPLSSVQDAGTLAVPPPPAIHCGDPAVVSVSLHATEGEIDATGEKTAAASEEVLPPPSIHCGGPCDGFCFPPC